MPSIFFKKSDEWIYSVGNYSAGRYVDGSSSLTSQFINALEKLTLRNDLSYLSLLSWGGVTSYRSIAPYKKWCHHCLNKMKTDNSTVYQPLLWNLQYINICPLHTTPLSNTCPSCEKLQPLLNRKGTIATCYKCNKWLGARVSKQVEVKNANFELWAASAISDLLRDTPLIQNFPTVNFIDGIIKDLEGTFSDITIPFDSILVNLPSKYTEKHDIAGSLRFDYMFSINSYKQTDHFYNLLRLIYIVGTPIQTMYDYNSFNVPSLPILNDLKECRVKYQRTKKLFRDFDYIIHNYSSFSSPEEILQFTGDTDNLLIEYIEGFFEDKNSLIEYNKVFKNIKSNKRL